MRVLLDTHAFLWAVLMDKRLSAAARNIIQDPANEVFLSPASYWELAIKISIGKYHLTEPFVGFMNDQLTQTGIVVLPISVEHAGAVTQLPHHHRDPFDRLLVAQALTENMAILSADPIFEQYGARRHW